MLQTISTPRFPNEPPEALANRATAFREGVKASAASGVRGAEVDKGLQSVMSTPALAGDQQTAGVRALGFQNPNDAQTLEKSLATQRATANNAGPSHGLQAPYSRYSAMRSGMQALLSAPDQLRNSLGTGVYDYVANAVAPYDMAAQMTSQAWGVGVTLVWSSVVAFIAYKVVDILIGLRVSEEVEREGLDTTEHGERAYHM